MVNRRQNNQSQGTRWHDMAYWGLLLLACVVFFVLNLWTSYKEDDMEFTLLHNAGFMDFMRSQYDHFMTSNGRCADFFATIFCAFLGKPVYNVCNTLVFALMAHLVCLLSVGRRSVLVLAMFVAFVALCYPVPGQTMLFVAGSCNYMWAITASLLLVYWLQRVQGKLMGGVLIFLMMALALVAGNFNEATSFGFFGGLVLYYAFNRDQLDRTAKLALLAYFLGLVIIIASPAAWNRAAQGGITVNLGLRDLLTSRGYIFAEKMLRSVTPVVAVVVGIVTLLWKGFGPIKRCKWVYILLCQALLMLVLGYLYDRAYAPLATVAFIIVAMAVDGLLSRWQWGRWLRIMAIALCLVLSAYSMSHAMGVLHRLKTFEDEIYREIVSAPRHAILHERQFTGYSRFATPLRYSSFDYFNRESTYCAYYNKDNVQFVNDSIYARYHTGRLLDGGQYLPLVSDRPDIADTVLRFPDQDYMIVVLNVDTLKPSPQFANYYLFPSDTVLTEQDRQFRNKYGLETEFTLRSYFPLYYQQRHLLVLPLIDDVTSHIVLQLDYEGDLGNLTLSRKPIVTN